MRMLQVAQSVFYKELFATDKQGKQFILNTKDYVFRDDRTGEVFGELKPLVQGFEYYLACEGQQ